MSDTTTRPQTVGYDFYFDTGAVDLQTSRRWMERAWRDGRLSGAKFGSRVRFRKADLDEFVVRNRKVAS